MAVLRGQTVRCLRDDGDELFRVVLDDGEIATKSVIVATDRSSAMELLALPPPVCRGHHMSVRLWCIASVSDDLPTVFTVCGTVELDFVYFCHRRETCARTWVRASGGEARAVVELHSYCTRNTKETAYQRRNST